MWNILDYMSQSPDPLAKTRLKMESPHHKQEPKVTPVKAW